MTHRNWDLQLYKTSYIWSYSSLWSPDFVIYQDGDEEWSEFYLVSDHVQNETDPIIAYHKLYTILRMINGATVLLTPITYLIGHGSLYNGKHREPVNGYENQKVYLDTHLYNPFSDDVDVDFDRVQGGISYLIHKSRTNVNLLKVLRAFSTFNTADFWGSIYSAYEIMRGDYPNRQKDIEDVIGAQRRNDLTQTCNFYRHGTSDSRSVISDLEALNIIKEITVHWLERMGITIKLVKSKVNDMDLSDL